MYNWTYYTPETVIEKFQAEYDCEVVYDDFDSNETMYAKIQTGGSNWDIVVPSGDYTAIMIAQNMFERIDHSKLANMGNIDGEVLRRASYDPAMEYSVPYYWGAAGVIVNKAHVPDFERSWSIFTRPDLAGKMTMLDDMREVMGDALKYLGRSVNETDPKNIFAARDLIEKSWKPNLGRFDADSFAKNYANGTFWVIQGYPEGVFQEIQGNAELERNTEFFIPEEGGPSYIDSLCILRGARNIELAHKFIDFIHRPEIYAEFCDYFRFPATVNVPARAQVKTKSMYDASALLNTEPKADVGAALDTYTDAWLNTIRVGG
jgi:spermidine/putrescine transport system substrate-binding protein